MPPVLSLVTGVLDRPESFRRLVDSIVAHTDVDWELVVVDASRIPVEYDDPRVRILPERPRQNYVIGYNRAFKECLGKWIIFLNDDAEVLSGYASTAVAFMEANPQIGLGALFYSENGGRFHVNLAYDTMYANFGIISKKVGDELQWFDEDLEMYGSDNSLAFKVLLADYGIAPIQHESILHHSEKDAHRNANEHNKWKASHVISIKYLVHNAKMRETYWKHRNNLIDKGRRETEVTLP